MLFTKLTLCSQIRNIVLKVAMNLVFIYLGEECLVITYSASCATMCLLRGLFGCAKNIDGSKKSRPNSRVRKKAKVNKVENMIRKPKIGHSRWEG